MTITAPWWLIVFAGAVLGLIAAVFLIVLLGGVAGELRKVDFSGRAAKATIVQQTKHIAELTPIRDAARAVQRAIEDREPDRDDILRAEGVLIDALNKYYSGD